ncbi:MULTISPECIES: hypothetical protein [unclassified Bradyrhizobium]|uniref:hypothetical protein n=1 Tax=unclassified Bradyrhizobium TaxID=2631580 RepID=UPI0029168018|nr:MULTISPECIES: hypothetical protein [unclassified Bradyrhizobium]
MSEQQLWCAVIQQAIIDATSPLSTTKAAERLDQLRSRDWLTKPNKDFNAVCALAGMEPIRVRAFAASLIVDASKHDRPLQTRSAKRRASRNANASPNHHA